MDDSDELELTEAPLAQLEADEEEDEDEEEEWQEFAAQVTPLNSSVCPVIQSNTCAESLFGSSGYSSLAGTSDNLRSVAGKSGKMDGHFSEGTSHGGSLEDLVGGFDKKLGQCFGDMNSDLSDFAPVQIRTHDELISQSKFWQDLTSSFGTVMPVDWSKTIIRNKLFLPVLALNCHPIPTALAPSLNANLQHSSNMDAASSDEELNAGLDLHNMVVVSHSDESLLCSTSDALASADDVIKEIDAIMCQTDRGEAAANHRQEEYTFKKSEAETETVATLPTLPSPLFEEKLQELNAGELVELQAELERLTQSYSEILIQQLALRDEQQFEKEVKNSFISELIKVQNKRRQFTMEKKRSGNIKVKTPDRDAKYLTTIIPYEPGHLTTRHMQIMIKILVAISDDSPTTPALLTDYILKVLCPKEDAML